MDFDTFARRAAEITGQVPAEFMAGVTGVHAHRGEKRHPHLPEVFTLGECGPDEVSSLTEPEAMRSRIHLYYGSFRAIAHRDPTFDWEAELRETVLHELRHHLEDRAGLPDLLDEDARDDLLHRFRAGEDLADGWYRCGEKMKPGVYRIGDDLFVELHLRPADLEAVRGTTIAMSVLDDPFEPPIPEDAVAGEILTWDREGLERPGGGTGDLHLVI